ncbi:hypothetical protein ACFVAV_08700 [Nocardia sp. NPDC057663]|uniref:hypothetical protein n=1 Tax=Nocardia sp. NPDC057663 TaxID=3346201 RepID=UPI003670BFD7
MIDAATTRRHAGDWAGACAAAHVDVDIDLRSLARTHGRELAARVRSDLRHLAPDLLRWHLPRVAPDGLLRPGLTTALARYDPEDAGIPCGSTGSVHLVVRTPPAWAEAGQRISLALWDGSKPGSGPSMHPHPRPNRRFRLDLHRHLWDARRTGELRMRSGAMQFAAHSDRNSATATNLWAVDPGLLALVPQDCAVDRWAAEAAILLRAEKARGGLVLVRFGARHRVVLGADTDGGETLPLRITGKYPRGGVSALPVLPDAATWVLPDLALLRAGAITADQLHPLVASALDPAWSATDATPMTGAAGRQRFVECRGERHRIGLVDGVLVALDHDPAEIRREELLVALTGTPLPCLQAIDRTHRRPDGLAGVRERLDHGDIAGALTVVEDMLGADAQLRDGPLRDALEAVAHRRITYGLFRAGLPAPGHGRCQPARRARREHGVHPRHATTI